MSFSISDFKSKGLIQGGARPSLFEAQLRAPTSVGSFEEGGRFLIKAAQIPASTTQAIDVGYFGRKVKVIGDRTFNDWTVTILNDENFKIRDVLEAWSNKLNSLAGNKMLLSSKIGSESAGGQGNAYKQDLIVRQFKKEQSGTGDAKASRAYKFIGAFPIAIDAINLDWDSTNRIEEFNVTFAYDYWIPIRGASYKSETGEPGGNGDDSK